MSGDEDDYLSDKFLINTNSSTPTPKTYAQIRREAERKAKLKNDENRLKTRRQREVEAREEVLSKSLFERAREEEDAGISSGNKALSMMMKMGFKPGQSLGKVDEGTSNSTALPESSDELRAVPDPEEKDAAVEKINSHKLEPLPLNEWAGKKGIGLGKRARSPTLSQRVAKMAKMAEETSQRDYRDRARQEYDERRAEGKLGPAQRTCATLDETSGKPFNVLWLNPSSPESFPTGLTDALAMRGHPRVFHEKQGESVQVRLRRQMQVDALEPLDGPSLTKSPFETFSSEQVEEVVQFLRLQAQDRLHLVLSYLRDNYNYCFWCGVQYENDEVMGDQCPGPDEELHD